jgi:prevent-host-death family protein
LTKLVKLPTIGSMGEAKIGEAKAHFSDLVKRAEQGEEIVIKRGEQPVAMLVQFKARAERKPGRLKGHVVIHDDFDELPPELAAEFGQR